MSIETGQTPAVEVSHLRAGYNGTAALDDVTFTVEKGCLAGLVGPNGSGKSTLLKVIMGLKKPSSGEVAVSGKKVRIGHSSIGYAPQADAR